MSCCIYLQRKRSIGKKRQNGLAIVVGSKGYSMSNVIIHQVLPGRRRKVVELKPGRVKLLIVIHIRGVVLVHILDELNN